MQENMMLREELSRKKMHQEISECKNPIMQES